MKIVGKKGAGGELKSIQSFLAKSNSLLKPSDYEALGNTSAPVVPKKRWSEKRKLQQKERRERQKLEEERKKLLAERKSKDLSNSARKRKINAITKWSQREHPDNWKRIVQKIVLKDIILKGKPWMPKTLVSYSDMSEIRKLKNENPELWTNVNLSKKFHISVFAIQKILRSRYEPPAEKVVLREEIVTEYKRLVRNHYAKEGRKEQMRLFEEDLQSRYGSLYRPPSRILRMDLHEVKELDLEEDETKETLDPTRKQSILHQARETVLKKMEDKSFKKIIDKRIELQKKKQKEEKELLAFYEGVDSINYQKEAKRQEKFFDLGPINKPFIPKSKEDLGTPEGKKFAEWKPLRSPKSSEMPNAFK